MTTSNENDRDMTIDVHNIAGLSAGCNVGDHVRVNGNAMPPTYANMTGIVTGIIKASGNDIYQVDVQSEHDNHPFPVRLLLSISEFDKIVIPGSFPKKSKSTWQSGFE